MVHHYVVLRDEQAGKNCGGVLGLLCGRMDCLGEKNKLWPMLCYYWSGDALILGVLSVTNTLRFQTPSCLTGLNEFLLTATVVEVVAV